MDKLQQFLNHSTSDGTVITYFNGTVTQTQIIQFVAVFLIIILSFAFLKKMAKLVVVLVCVLYLVVTMGIASPTKLVNTAVAVKENGTEMYEFYTKAKDKIKFDGDKASIKVNGEWIDVDSISSIVSVGEGLASIYVNGENVAISDADIVEFLKYFE